MILKFETRLCHAVFQSKNCSGFGELLFLDTTKETGAFPGPLSAGTSAITGI
jgi:hypothetical protein